MGSQWFNLNSLLEGPELVSNTYLGEFLAQLQHEGYSLFLVTGDVRQTDKKVQSDNNVCVSAASV